MQEAAMELADETMQSACVRREFTVLAVPFESDPSCRAVRFDT